VNYDILAYCEYDDEEDVPDSDEAATDLFHINEHDESIILGLMGLIGMTMFYG
jgi:hypothetical protein